MPPLDPEVKPKIPEAERRLLIKLMRRVSRENGLRYVFDAETGALTTRPNPASILCSILKNSAEYDWRSRTVALRLLRYASILPEDRAEVAAVTGQIMNGSDTSGPQRVIMRGLLLVGRWTLCALPLLITILLILLYQKPLPDISWLEPLLIIFSALLAIGTLTLPLASPIYDAVRANDIRIEAAKTLAALQLSESVGALAKAARSENFRADIARSALLQLLPTLTETHYGQIGADATPELCALLTWAAPDAPYMESILVAISKIGDGRAVAPVEKFAEYYAGSSVGRQAQNILPILRLRREQENAFAMLLRHSSAPIEAGQLLRAASASREMPPNQLLRPAPQPPNDLPPTST